MILTNILRNVTGVYMIINLINNKFYIGSSLRIRSRLQRHLSESKNNNSGSILHSAIRKHGVTNFKAIVLNECSSGDEAFELEQLYIETMKPAYNCGRSLYKNAPNLGKKLSEQWKQRIREANKGYKHSLEVMSYLSKINKANAIKLEFKSNNVVHKFNSWKEAGIFFNTSHSPMSVGHRNKGTWTQRKTGITWDIFKLTEQKKAVKITYENKTIKYYNSASQCDKDNNFWKGATSNAIKSKNGNLYNNKLEYI